MIKVVYNVIGVMSGTSLDGIDLAYITFERDNLWKFKIHKAETINYSEFWKKELANLTSFSLDELIEIDKDYTHYLSKVIKHFIDEKNIKNIDAICSHGHTALHQPENKLTYQIGNLPIISKLIDQNVVCDFRIQDVALNGQGAPLVPIGDELLFSEYDYCLNLGGFANVSARIENKRIAFDICPVNIVLNRYVESLGIDYDNKGEIAKSGKINITLLKQLNNLSFYIQDYPKSLGLEWVENNIFPLIDSFRLEIKDILATFVEHIAIQITHILNAKNNATILISGGGVYNSYLINRIEILTKNKIIIPDNDIIEYKEALIFGLLGILKLRNENNCLSSVTGAKKDHSSGNIFIP